MSKEALAQAERFAMTEYLTTLAGPPPQGEAARAFYAQVAKMTGIPEEDVAKSRGFLRDLYLKSLRSADGMVVSRYDGSFAVDDPFPDSRGERAPDPVLDGFTRAYAGAFVGYARDAARLPDRHDLCAAVDGNERQLELARRRPRRSQRQRRSAHSARRSTRHFG